MVEGAMVSGVMFWLSGSTSEILAAGMKDLKRARLFGDQTAGAALPSTFEKLPTGDGFQYVLGDLTSTSGFRIEGQGVKPDVLVEPTRAQLLTGRDAVRAGGPIVHGRGLRALDRVGQWRVLAAVASPVVVQFAGVQRKARTRWWWSRRLFAPVAPDRPPGISMSLRRHQSCRRNLTQQQHG